MQISEELIRNVVSQVIQEVRSGQHSSATAKRLVSTRKAAGANGQHGLFTCAKQAVSAARAAFEQLRTRPMEDRKKAIEHIRRISISQAVELGTMEMNETKIGRLEHKIDKLETLGRPHRELNS